MKPSRLNSDFSRYLCSLAFAISLTVINLNCKTKSPVQPGTSPPPLPALSDSIPFDKLGTGKLVFERIGPSDNNYGGIYVIDVDQRRSWGIGDGAYDGAAVSPDGQKIAYTTSTAYSGPCDSIIYVMNIDGTGSERVCELEGWKHSPSWTPDGKQILFTSCLFNTYGYLLYRQSPVPSPSDRTVIIDFNKVNPPWVYVPDGPVAVSPDGKMAVSINGIWTFDSGGSNIRMISGDRYSPAWSPDGKTLAALSVPSGSSGNTTAKVSVSVMLFDSSGVELKTLVTLSATGTSDWYGDNSNSLCWSPDGSRLAFTRPDGAVYGAHIYLINRDGTGLTQVTTAPGVTDRSLSWSR